MSRWRDYYIADDFEGFWRDRLCDERGGVLVILGVGFDPRCLVTTRLLSRLGAPCRIGCVVLQLTAQPALGRPTAIIRELEQSNGEALDCLAGCEREAVLAVETHDDEGHSIVGRRSLEMIKEVSGVFRDYRDVVVDISGMPRGMFFPLLSYLLRFVKRGDIRNLHVAVVEDPDLDSRISGREYEKADFLHTFRHHGPQKLIWLPLVGTDERTRLEKIQGMIENSCIEICPILPFPARSLRRCDDIMLRHRDLLFDGFLVSRDNVLLCDERSPFDIYRKILDVEKYYRQRLGALQVLEGVVTVLSPLSSKTLSLGMLLAAVERGLPVCHVEPGTYDVKTDEEGKLPWDKDARPTEIWLAGEPYDA